MVVSILHLVNVEGGFEETRWESMGVDRRTVGDQTKDSEVKTEKFSQYIKM